MEMNLRERAEQCNTLGTPVLISTDPRRSWLKSLGYLVAWIRFGKRFHFLVGQRLSRKTKTWCLGDNAEMTVWKERSVTATWNGRIISDLLGTDKQDNLGPCQHQKPTCRVVSSIHSQQRNHSDLEPDTNPFSVIPFLKVDRMGRETVRWISIPFLWQESHLGFVKPQPRLLKMELWTRQWQTITPRLG